MRCAILAAALLFTQHAAAWRYDDEYNYLAISGTVCRAEDGAAERRLRHNPGSTSAVRSAESVRVYCPLNRRNLHAYDKSLDGSGETVDFRFILVRVDSPSGNLQCRLFAKQRFRPTVTYSDWKRPMRVILVGKALVPYPHPLPRDLRGFVVPGYPHMLFRMESDEPWETLNWGVMCDVPGGEAVKSIVMLAHNNNW